MKTKILKISAPIDEKTTQQKNQANLPQDRIRRLKEEIRGEMTHCAVL
jgi:hypothetical protein